MTASTRRIVIVALAPSAPPCFEDRNQWVEYLTEADLARRDGERGPICSRKGEPVFNFALDFCQDCTARHALAMVAQGRCNPHHLADLELYAPKPIGLSSKA